ncbi:MAG: 2-oxo acid dehydrogenase subunit E2 [Chloroflexi bacterium]|nr:2-oxo acid dehydrogenase subunit E2 [Chloroflexota bacterium]
MALYISIPQLGMSMTRADVVGWKIKEGQWVEAGCGVVEIQTEKVATEVQATAPGFVHIWLQRGDDVPVGRVIGVLAESQEELKNLQRNPPKVMSITELQEAGPPGLDAGEAVAGDQRRAGTEGFETRPGTGEGERLRISPLARRMAKEHGIDVTRVAGTGPGGRIGREDIEKAIEANKAAPPSSLREKDMRVVPLSAMRRTIAERMSLSVRTAPHFWVMAEADMTNLLELRERLLPTILEETGARLTLTDLIIRIVVEAIKEHPYANAFFTDSGITLSSDVHIGVATEVPNGLIVPVIRGADVSTLPELVTRRADLVKRCREGRLDPGEVTGSTFTLNNVGAVGIKSINAIINPPESAILTTGSITRRPVVVGEAIVARPMMDLNLAADHRVLDGGSAGRFLQCVKELIENPRS